jgi:hypothetical protein
VCITKFLYQLSDQQLHSISPFAQHYVLSTELCSVIFAIPCHPLSLSSSFCCHYLNEMLLSTPFSCTPTSQVVSKCHHCGRQGVGSDSGAAFVNLRSRKEWQMEYMRQVKACSDILRENEKFYSWLTVNGTQLVLQLGWAFGNYYVLRTARIYVFCVDLRTNNHYFPIQH